MGNQVRKVSLFVLDVETFYSIQLEQPQYVVLSAMQSQVCHLQVCIICIMLSCFQSLLQFIVLGKMGRISKEEDQISHLRFYAIKETSISLSLPL